MPDLFDPTPGTGHPSSSLTLSDHAGRGDLKIYLERIARAGLPDIWLITRGQTLAVFGCTQAPESLTDRVATVLVLRSFALAVAPTEAVDEVVPARALLDRIARLGIVGLTLEVPDATTTAAWAGVLPPNAGWEPAGAIDADSLAAVAEEGARRIAQSLPEAPGEPVVRRARVAVWGAEIAPGVPAAAAFAADAMGFLSSGSAVRMSTTRVWRRLASEQGDVLIRSPLR